MDKILNSETFKHFKEKWAANIRSPQYTIKKPAPYQKTVASSSTPVKARNNAKASLTIKLDSFVEADPVLSRPNSELHLRHISHKSKLLQKDAFGFLMPAPPLSKFEKKQADCRRLLTMSWEVLGEEEYYYTLEQLTTYCERVIAKSKRRQLTLTDQMQSGHPNWKPVEKWVSEVSRYYNPKNSTRDVQTSHEETSQPKNKQRLHLKRLPTYILKDWTILKSPQSCNIKLAGVLVNLSDNKVYEDDHVSSNVTERLSDRTVLTDKCKYILVGKCITTGVPQQIKDYFVSNTFPENWEAVIELWNDTEVLKKPAGGAVKKRAPTEKNKALSKSQKNTPNKTERRHRRIPDIDLTMEEGEESETSVVKKRKVAAQLSVEAEINTPRTARNRDESVSLHKRNLFFVASHGISEASSSSQFSQAEISLRSRSARKENEVSSQTNLKKYPVTPIVIKKKTSKTYCAFC